ncbi:MAG TPA: hypothetical protein VNL37_06110 [Candidatus Polarisedimenticolia bacterium]|nr:hypothetical protein [Candidatus Polarisedimenticolia bacterium]
MTAAFATLLIPTFLAAAQALTHTVRLDSAREISVSYPDGWSIARPTPQSWVILDVPADEQETATPTVRILVGYGIRTDHPGAVRELLEYARESSAPSTFLAIGGWPGLQRVQTVMRPQPSQGPLSPDRRTVRITTAVAAGDLLVRLEAQLPSDADQTLKDLVLAIGRSLVFGSAGDPSEVQQELDTLRAAPGRPERPTPAPGPGREEAAGTAMGFAPLSAGAGPPIFPTALLNNGSNGELEVAVSNNGSNIVIVKQSGFITSNDGGQTFPYSGFLPVGDGDSSIAFGQSTRFYHSALGCFGTNCAAVCPANSNCAEIAASTDNGRTFGGLINAVVCPNSGGSACNIDQEHIGADRVNAGTGGADRVYMAFRNCQGGCGAESDVTCSPDSGATWAPRLALEAGSDFPRVAVGGDGSFYVVFRNGGNIRIDKFNACATSLGTMTRAAGGFPRTVSGFTDFAGCEVANGFGGLDRCNDGNILSGPTVTVDDTDPSHVYVAWATNTAADNEDVLVADSVDGGVNWRAPVRVNTSVAARRYHPWVCATGGNGYVTWYDRRAASVAQNDLTDYFAASAGLSSGNLVANNDEFQISTASDPQCNLWPAAPRSTFDAENCSVQPQLAGFCKLTPVPTPDTSSNTRCDFAGPDATVCPFNPDGPETCQTGNGAVKYGDYNGNACVLGRLYTVFASGAGLTSVRNFFQSFVVSSTPTTVTYTGATTGDFHDDVTLSAFLTLSGTLAPVSGETLSFTVGVQGCSAVTDGTGSASCTLTLNQASGGYTVTASFAGSGLYEPGSTSAPFTITREETTLSYTGDTVIANGTTAHLSGVLLEDGLVPIAGRTVGFTLGTGGGAQSCSGVTDASGVAACTIAPVSQPGGPGVVADAFAGDAFYLPSSSSAATIVFAFLDQGAFVLGDQTAVVGPATVEFWGNDWSVRNVLSGGSAPASFKGFASTIGTNPPSCGSAWTSSPGNSSAPPDMTLPLYMGVVVSGVIDMSGSTISGAVPKIVVIRIDPGYAPSPGRPGTGTIVAVYCH